MDNSNVNSKIKNNKKMVICKNCRQSIESEKMFLHEGFCQRNNIFCDHCKKVFLKKDYEKHLIKKSMNHLKTPDRPIRREKIPQIQPINIYTSPVITKRKTAFEYIEMPMTEQYKVNNPIIITENGQVLSNRNNNEYLLPYFGIRNSTSNEQKLIVDDIIINEDEFYEEKSPILMTDNNMNINKIIESSLKNSLRMNNNNYGFNETQNIVPNIDILNSKLNIIEFTQNKDILNSNNRKIINKSRSSDYFFKNTNFNNNNIVNPQYNNTDKNNIQINSDSKKIINSDKNPKNNNIIINNNIITYNSNNNINKIHNFFNSEENDKLVRNKINENSINSSRGKSLMNNNIFQDTNPTQFNPTRTTKKNEIIKFKKIIEKNIKINNSQKITKEPNDSGTKTKPRNNKTKITKFILDRLHKNESKNNSKKKGKVKTEKKKNRMSFKCQFCESEVDDLLRHYKIYHYKMSKEIFKPQKRDTTLFYEILKNPDNMEETGIEETNKKILLRQINPNFNLKEKFDDNMNKIIYKTTQKKKSTQAIFKSPNVIKKVNNLDHSNLESNVNSEKKTFPEDNLRGSFLARSQAREYDRKIILGENLQHRENKKNKKGILFRHNVINIDNISYNKNGNISPIYFPTDSKRIDYYKRKDDYRSPVVKKINFLKTALDEEKY
jgi:hypothetical protein